MKLCRVETGETFFATRPVLWDACPAFDPGGDYLYFIGRRVFNPVYDELHFDLGFPLGSRPYAIALRADVASPFVPKPRPLTDDDDDGDADDENEGEEVPEVLIDLDGIEDRIVGFPVPEGRYEGIAGIKGKAVYLNFPVEGSLGDDYADSSEGTLHVYDFAKQKQETLVGDVSEFRLGRDRSTLLYQAGRRLRVVKAGEEPESDETPGRTSGWVDLSRVKVSIRPEAEWRQMFREAWRLQRENFWTEDMAGLDWDGVYLRYLPLVDRVTTRGEFSDLLWELLGELGTSHAYESGGAYRPRPHYRQGKLGVDWAFEEGVHRIAKIVGGDRWDPEATSPLNRLGVDVRPGDVVLAVNGQPVGAEVSPDELLVNQADQEVQLTIQRGDERRTVTVKAIDDEQPGRYRDWVEANRPRCHELSGGRIGYLHIPDMLEGYAEFHRGFLTEYDREALVVDVRFNGGGHVSSLLLEKLARRRLGYNFPAGACPSPTPRSRRAARWWRSPTSGRAPTATSSATPSSCWAWAADRQAHLGRGDRHLAPAPPGRRDGHHPAGVLLRLRRRGLAGGELRHRPRHRGRHHPAGLRRGRGHPAGPGDRGRPGTPGPAAAAHPESGGPAPARGAAPATPPAFPLTSEPDRPSGAAEARVAGGHPPCPVRPAPPPGRCPVVDAGQRHPTRRRAAVAVARDGGIRRGSAARRRRSGRWSSRSAC